MNKRETDVVFTEMQKLITDCMDKLDKARATKEYFWKYKNGEIKVGNSEARKSLYDMYGSCIDFVKQAEEQVKSFGKIRSTDKRFINHLLVEIKRKAVAFSPDELEKHIHQQAEGGNAPRKSTVPFLSSLRLNQGKTKLKNEGEVPGQMSLFDDKEGGR